VVVEAVVVGGGQWCAVVDSREAEMEQRNLRGLVAADRAGWSMALLRLDGDGGRRGAALARWVETEQWTKDRTGEPARVWNREL